MAWLQAPDDRLSHLLLERALGAIYLLAYVATLHQFPALLGEDGLLPVPRFLQVVPFRHAPSLFYVGYSDRLLRAVAWAGIILSGAIVLGLPQNGPAWLAPLVWLLLWLGYVSIVNVGQTFYAFGWESLLLEVGFLAIFLGPDWVTPPTLVFWLVRWLLFRVEFGAGLIKLRGDPCWRDFTCLYYHHETQPLPNPLSWYFHHLPRSIHRLEGRGNHVLQLVVPFGLFAPQPIAGIAGLLMFAHQGWLVLSGNFAWLNVLTMTLAIAALDDRQLGLVLPLQHPALSAPAFWQTGLVVACTVLVVALSYWPVRNMLSRRQAMNASFNPLHLVNTYGAFGGITRERYEVILEGTEDQTLTPSTVWKEYDFLGKPGDPTRRPPQVAPYHLRLDWLMWFAALSSYRAHGWLLELMGKLLLNDAPILKLMRRNPFPEKPPTFVRATLYLYRFTTWQERRESGAWWVRRPVREYVPPLQLTPEEVGGSVS